MWGTGNVKETWLFKTLKLLHRLLNSSSSTNFITVPQPNMCIHCDSFGAVHIPRPLHTPKYALVFYLLPELSNSLEQDSWNCPQMLDVHTGNTSVWLSGIAQKNWHTVYFKELKIAWVFHEVKSNNRIHSLGYLSDPSWPDCSSTEHCWWLNSLGPRQHQPMLKAVLRTRV